MSSEQETKQERHTRSSGEASSGLDLGTNTALASGEEGIDASDGSFSTSEQDRRDTQENAEEPLGAKVEDVEKIGDKPEEKTEDTTNYVYGFKLFLIFSGLMLTTFLLALVSHGSESSKPLRYFELTIRSQNRTMQSSER